MFNICSEVLLLSKDGLSNCSYSNSKIIAKVPSPASLMGEISQLTNVSKSPCATMGLGEGTSCMISQSWPLHGSGRGTGRAGREVFQDGPQTGLWVGRKQETLLYWIQASFLVSLQQSKAAWSSATKIQWCISK